MKTQSPALPNRQNYSSTSQSLSNINNNPRNPTAGTDNNSSKVEKTENPSTYSANEKTQLAQLTEQELQQLKELKQRDREVKTHEAAHLAAAGQYAKGGAKFEYQRGPDGKNYAVGGEVSIDTSPIPNNPEATIKKAQQLQAAAHAPMNPSTQDRQVAAQAAQMETQARMELAKQRSTGQPENNNVEVNSSENRQNKAATNTYHDIEHNHQSQGHVLNLIA